MTIVRNLLVSSDEKDLRIDRWFKRHFPEISHGYLQKLMRTGQVRVNGARVKSSTRLEEGQVIRIPPISMDTKKKSHETGSGLPKDEFSLVHQKDILNVLKDSSKLSPEVRKDLKEENAYTEFQMQDTKKFQK